MSEQLGSHITTPYSHDEASKDERPAAKVVDGYAVSIHYAGAAMEIPGDFFTINGIFAGDDGEFARVRSLKIDLQRY